MKRIILPKAAKEAGYRPMTNPYVLPAEAWMLQNVIADMERGKADYALVEVKVEQVEVWRK
jgi:hypothetical protein